MIKVLQLSFIILLLQTGNLFAQVQLDATGSANNFTITYPAMIQAVPSGGISYSFKSNQTITSNATLNLNGTGAKPIYKNYDQPLVAGDIKAGHFVQVIYDVANSAWQMLSVSAIPISSGASAWSVSGNNIVNTNTSFVGINNTAPGYTLDVGGDINLKNDIYAGGFRSFTINPNGTSGNAFVGKTSGNTTLAGSGNSFFGSSSGGGISTGTNNVFLGANAGAANSTGSSNVYIGSSAGQFNSAGNQNIFIGNNAVASNIGGTGNIVIGSGATAAAALTNAVAMGANSLVSGSNMMALGGTGSNKLKVGIGVSNPANDLHVAGGVRIENLSTSGAVFANSNGDLFVSTSSGSNAWTINGTNTFPLPLANNIGIGTSVPGQKLVVAGNTSIGGFITTTGQLMAGSANISNLVGPALVSVDPAGNLVLNANPGVTAWTINGANIFPQNLTQNVGIGTSVPGTKLGVSGAITVDVLGANDGSAGLFPTSALRFGPSSGEGITSRRLAGANQNGLDFWTSTANRMSITSAGNVGIGTTAPNAKLHVIGNTTTSGTIMTQNVQASSGTATTSSYSFLSDLTSGMYLVNTNIIGFATNNTLRMIVDGFGNVGIGATSLTNRLEVSGAAAIGAYAGVNAAPANGLIVSGNVGIGTSVPIGILDINGGANYSTFIRSTNGTLRFASSANQNFIESGLTTATGSAADLIFTDMNNQNQWMVIKATGNVGIGILTPLSNLHVINNIAIGATATATGTYALALGPTSLATGNYSTAIGYQCKTTNSYSVSMGFNCSATGAGNFVFAGNPQSSNGFNGVVLLGDYSSTPINVTSADKMYAAFQNGYTFYSNSALSTGVSIAAGGTSWTTISDSTKKEKYEPVNTDLFLDNLRKMKIGSWNYKATNSQMRHYGPYAQEFDSYFGKDKWGRIGTDTTISTQDAEGVLFILSQGLEKRTTEQKLRIVELEATTKNQHEEIELLRKILHGRDEEMKNIKTSFDKKYTSLESELDAIKRHLGLHLKSENK